MVRWSEGEYLQYLVSSPSASAHFVLLEGLTKQVVLTERVPATLQDPATYTRLWPVVGDRPQHESSAVLLMEFGEPNLSYRFQVLHRGISGEWTTAIDIEFQSATGGDSYEYSFRILAD